MLIGVSLAWIMLAGIANGSFAIPSRSIHQFSTEKIWLYHSLIGLLVLPWLILTVLFPHIFSYYVHLNALSWFWLFFGGLVFGFGQIFFAYSMQYLSIALAFTVNLSLGTLLGSMFVVFYHHQFFSYSGLIVTFAVLLIIVSLVVFYIGNHKKNMNYQRHYQRGWLLAISAGIASGLQNAVFIIVLSTSSAIMLGQNPFWIWPPFLTIAAFVIITVMAKKLFASQINNLMSSHAYKNIAYIILMGMLFTGSLLLYSIGVANLSTKMLIIAWPMFMIIIILTCKMWSWRQKEYKNLNKWQISYQFFGIILLVAAIVLLARFN